MQKNKQYQHKISADRQMHNQRKSVTELKLIFKVLKYSSFQFKSGVPLRVCIYIKNSAGNWCHGYMTWSLLLSLGWKLSPGWIQKQTSRWQLIGEVAANWSWK